MLAKRMQILVSGVFLSLMVTRLGFAEPPKIVPKDVPKTVPKDVKEAKDNSVDSELQLAVANTQVKLGNLEPWQKKLFDEEVLPEYQRFIRNYRTDNGVHVDIDEESLKDYLFFYAPTALKKRDPKILVALKAESGCQKCSEITPELTQLVRSRLERRGWNVVFLPPSETEVSAVSLDKVTTARKLNASLMVQWATSPVDDLDTAHADEKHYFIRSRLKLNDLTFESEKKDLLDNDRFDLAGAKTLTDLFTELGAKKSLFQAEGKLEESEVQIEVSGIQDFPQYNRVRAHYSLLLKDYGSIEDRELAKGKVVFAISTQKSKDEVRRQIASVPLDSGDAQRLQVEVK